MFSVVVPVHNKEPHVRRSIDSILNQTFKEFELIVVDDASSDGSLRVIEQYNDSRIRVFRRDTPGPGGYAARNLGIQEARYSWIAFLDADDAWEPAYLERMREAIEREKDIQVFVSGYSVVEGQLKKPNAYYRSAGGKGSHRFDFITFLRKKPACTDSIVIARDTLLASGAFPDGRSLRGGDQDTWLRVMARVRVGFWIDYLGALYYRDSENMVTKKVGFRLESHIMFHTVNNLLAVESDPAIRKALRRHWNNTAMPYFRNIAKTAVIKPAYLKYYFWDWASADRNILLYIIYSLKHLTKKKQ